MAASLCHYAIRSLPNKSPTGYFLKCDCPLDGTRELSTNSSQKTILAWSLIAGKYGIFCGISQNTLL